MVVGGMEDGHGQRNWKNGGGVAGHVPILSHIFRRWASSSPMEGAYVAASWPRAHPLSHAFARGLPAPCSPAHPLPLPLPSSGVRCPEWTRQWPAPCSCWEGRRQRDPLCTAAATGRCRAGAGGGVMRQGRQRAVVPRRRSACWGLRARQSLSYG